MAKLTQAVQVEMPQIPKFRPPWRIIIPVALLILLPLLCIRTIDAGQVGVITRYGEVSREVQSGLAFKLPWPVEKLYRMDTRIQKQEERAEAASSDLQVVSATLAVN